MVVDDHDMMMTMMMMLMMMECLHSVRVLCAKESVSILNVKNIYIFINVAGMFKLKLQGTCAQKSVIIVREKTQVGIQIAKFENLGSLSRHFHRPP
jgi:hypothetical protein